MAMDIDMFDEYYGGGEYTRKIVYYDDVTETEHVIGTTNSPKGDLGNSKPRTREALTGFWGEILKDEVVNIEPVPEPPKLPVPPPSRYVGDRRKVPSYDEFCRLIGFLE